MSELDQAGLGVVVEEDTPPYRVEVDCGHIDGGEHVLEHGGHEGHMPLLFRFSRLLEPVRVGHLLSCFVFASCKICLNCESIATFRG